MTPTTPRKAMTVTPPVAAGVAGNGPAGASPAAPAKKKKPVVAIIAVVALLVAGVGGFFLWKTLNPGPPLTTAPTETLVKYVLSPKFMEAPGDKKPLYLGALENRQIQAGVGLPS